MLKSYQNCNYSIYRIKHALYVFLENTQSSAILVCASPLLNILIMRFGILINLSVFFSSFEFFIWYWGIAN